MEKQFTFDFADQSYLQYSEKSLTATIYFVLLV